MAESQSLFKKPTISFDQMIDVLNNSSDGIMVTDHLGTVTYVSPVAYENMGLPEKDLIGRNVDDLVKEGRYDHSVVKEAIVRGERTTGIVTVKEGNRVVSTCTPIFDANHKIIMTVTNVRVQSLMDKYLEELNAVKAKSRRYKSAIEYIGSLDQSKNAIIAESPAMVEILSYLEKVAWTNSTVYLQGESGTGKEVLSRFIHNESQRSNEPFIPVNCAAIPTELLESEFFGYEKGAFSGALTKGKPGFFEMADTGTLFLDEIGDMPLNLQTKLLRTIESGEVQRLGGTTLIKTDVRLIVATNKDLALKVKDGSFREDLYYRINVIPVKIPPLRERKEDIVPIAEHFISQFNRKYDTGLSLTPEMKKTLEAHNWPGNIRELRNLIERMVIVPGSINDIAELTTAVPASEPAFDAAALSEKVAQHSGDLKSLVKAVEKEYISRLLNEKEWRVNEIADILGIHRSMLYRKMQELGIQKKVGVK
ncbi:sigma-54 interaction domain-containing protein [Youngiibacter fragilis]|uniref:Diguanylate cyclase n=1 Tax=Youngiibacter fragilis 232.1 TaxID=994573 RepID=V7I2W6_9CLOT|nr:sigma-54-dependent Fis family transcriptional regulator [Youngiibacter fragilis]ETA79362.1 diguanylate cyclase [Youngiibacter fragilis 232.1]